MDMNVWIRASLHEPYVIRFLAKSEEDFFVTIGGEGMKWLGRATAPGAYWVDFIPWCECALRFLLIEKYYWSVFSTMRSEVHTRWVSWDRLES